MLCGIASLAICLFSACEKDDSSPIPATDSNNTGEVTYKIDVPGGAGSGTASSPIAVSPDGALNMEIAQNSTYKDPNGQTITHEPKASIAVNVLNDTVYAKSLDDLKQLKYEDAISTDKSGTFPVRHQMDQTLEIGGQKICLDMAYDVFTIINSTNNSVEMPYIRLNPAKLGSAGATEEKPEGRASVAVTDISVRPLAVSRAQTITDSTMYEVNVRFNIGLESVNAVNPYLKTLEFSATYVGVVETTTTLADPKAELSYAWDIKGGTNSTSSPFVQTNDSDMELCLTQTSVYTDEYSNRYVSEPKATVRISALRDTVWVTTVEDLTKLVETSSDTSTSTFATQTFTTGDKSITIDWNYQTAASPEGLDVNMPYYKLSPVKLKTISEKKLENDNSTSENSTDAYRITATFVQTATANGMDGDYARTFDIEYVVSYISALKIKLVDVKYNRRYEWYDPEYNLALRSCYIIERELIYSNGETKKEEYRSGNYMLDVFLRMTNPFGSSEYLEEISDDEVLTFAEYKAWGNGPTHSFRGAKTGVPDLNKVSDWYLNADRDENPYGPEYYHTYTGQGLEFGTTEHKEGWYVRYAPYYWEIGITYEGYIGPRDSEIRLYGHHHGYVDRFYYFADTDTIIDFRDWMAKRESNVSVVDTLIPEGPARLYKMELKSHYLGKVFHTITVDTVYQNK